MSLDPADKECSISHTFRHVYRFILEAMKGDTAFSMSERDLSSRGCVGIGNAHGTKENNDG
jgi:hypothetical protein